MSIFKNVEIKKVNWILLKILFNLYNFICLFRYDKLW